MFGDIIFVERKRLWFNSYEARRTTYTRTFDQIVARFWNFRHYGIEVEDGYVIHFLGKSFVERKRSLISKTTMEEFLKDGQLQVVNNIPRIYSSQEIVERAYSMLGSDFGGYTLVDNNCEHFVTWCACDYKKSTQSRALKVGHRIVTSPKYVKPLSVKAKNATLRMIGIAGMLR